MKKIEKINMLIMFLGIIFLIPILTFIQKDKDISLVENRALAEKPAFSKRALYEGEYFTKWETYLSDHIFARDYWVKAYTYINMFALDKTKINNIVIGDDGVLLPFHSYKFYLKREVYESNITKMTEQIKELDDTIMQYGGKFYFIGIPEQSSYYRDKYPSYLNNHEEYLNDLESIMFENLDKQGVKYINMNEKFKSSNQNDFYFKTDHHFNFNGAYKSYCEIVKTMTDDDIEIATFLGKDDMDITTISKHFIGSRNRSIYYMYPSDQDIVEIAYPKEKIDYEKITNDNPDPELYNLSDDEVVSYGVYMGGDKAHTVIKTDRPELPNILIFGDSFTNALEPLLCYHFNETHVLDFRYYKEMSLYEYIDKYKPDVVIMVRDDLNYGTLEGNGSFK